MKLLQKLPGKPSKRDFLLSLVFLAIWTLMWLGITTLGTSNLTSNENWLKTHPQQVSNTN